MNHVNKGHCDTPDCNGSCIECCCFVCKVCGLYEGGLTTECCGRHVDSEFAARIYEGHLDFRKGQWCNDISIHSPKFRGINEDYVKAICEERGIEWPEKQTMQCRLLFAFRQAYHDGYKDSLKNYAVWKNGEQETAMGRNVKEIINQLGNETVPLRY